MKNIKNFRAMDCTGCQCDGCYECQSANCDMYYIAKNKKRCDFD